MNLIFATFCIIMKMSCNNCKSFFLFFHLIRKTMAIVLTDSNFEELVLHSDKPVLVDFWAEWCGPCRIIGPIVNEIGEDFKDQVVVGKLDVDNNPAVSSKYGIRNIPTILFFKNGQVADKQVGAVPKSNLVHKVEALL